MIASGDDCPLSDVFSCDRSRSDQKSRDKDKKQSALSKFLHKMTKKEKKRKEKEMKKK